MTDPVRGKAAAHENRNANCSCKKHMPDRAVLIKQYGICFPKVACCIQAEHPKNPWTLRVFYFLYRSYCFLYPHFGHTPFSFSAMPQRGQRSKVPSGLYS